MSYNKFIKRNYSTSDVNAAGAIKFGFEEADRDSEWWSAIDDLRCGEAMRLVREDATLLRKTGPYRRTALHAAVIGGWGHQIVKELLVLCGRHVSAHPASTEESSSEQQRLSSSDNSVLSTDNNIISSSSTICSSSSINSTGSISSTNSMSISFGSATSRISRGDAAQLVWELLEAVDGEYEQNAVTMAVVIGSTKVVRTLMRAYEKMEREEDEYKKKYEHDVLRLTIKPLLSAQSDVAMYYPRPALNTQELDSDEQEQKEHQYLRRESVKTQEQRQLQLCNIITTLISEDDDSFDERELLNYYCNKVKEFHNEGPEYAFHAMCYQRLQTDPRSLFIDILRERRDPNELQRSYSIIDYAKGLKERVIRGMLERRLNDVLKTIVERAERSDPSLVPYLFKLQDHLGMTPLHAAISSGNVKNVRTVLELIPLGAAYSKECVNAVDGAGRTPLHRAAAACPPEMDYRFESDMIEILHTLLNDSRSHLKHGTNIFEPLEYFIPRNFTLRSQLEEKLTSKNDPSIRLTNLTPLHLSILHNHLDRMKILVKHPDCSRAAGVVKSSVDNRDHYVYFKVFAPPGWIEQRYFTTEDSVHFGNFLHQISLLFMAALMRNEKMVQALLEHEDIVLDRGAIQTKDPISVLHVASCCGHPEILKVILDNQRIDPMVTDNAGHTALHYATDAFSLTFDLNRVEYCVDLYNLKCYESNKRKLVTNSKGYAGKKECINMLLQAGLEVWSRGNEGNTPSPGLLATKEDREWWHEKVNTETKDAKKSLTDAANAVAVTGALVATTSFVGPLQPPLGYSGPNEDLNYDSASIRVFIICVSISFYLVVASIMLSLLPSLPLAQSSLHNELRRTRKVVIVAVCLLLLSIVFELVSFAAATIAVLPNSLSQIKLTLSTAILGAIVCIFVLFFCVFRLVRLVYYRKPYIRHLYDRLDLF